MLSTVSTISRLQVKTKSEARKSYRNQRRQRTAVLRAATAAGLYIDGSIPTVREASEACGANARYVAAVVSLLKAEDLAAIRAALAGRVSLLRAAKETRRAARLISAYRAATPADRAALGRAVSAELLFSDSVAPALG